MKYKRISDKSSRIVHVIYLVIIFGCFYIFYTQIVPVMVCDPDDWTYISVIRAPWPAWNNWNPAKIFPETLEGLCGDFAAFVIYPITGNYLHSFTIVFAFVISFFICIYLYSFNRFLIMNLQLSIYRTVFTSTIFLALHFLIFKTKTENNPFLLTASNLNCFMNYLVPALLSCSLAFYFLCDDLSEKIRSMTNVKLGFTILTVYLVIFSNMVTNVLFVIPTGCAWLCKLYKNLRGKKLSGGSIGGILQDYSYIFVFALELICLFFEYSGGRAQSLEFNLEESISGILEDIKIVINYINLPLLGICMITIITALLLWKTEKEKDHVDYRFIKVFSFASICLVLCDIYTICLFTRVGGHKLTRCENCFVLFFYYIVLFAWCLGYITRKIQKSIICFPLICFIFFIEIVRGEGSHTYLGSISYYRFNTDMCERINQNIVDQFIQADQSGATEINLILPEDGLGYYSFTGDRIAVTLYRHGIVSKRMTVHIVEGEFLE